MSGFTLLEGDVRRALAMLDPETVQCCVTSPPYLWVRQYSPDDDPNEIGVEPTLELYIEHLVDVFRHVRRVLRKDGSLWVVISDTYARRAGGGDGQNLKIGKTNTLHTNSPNGRHSYRKVTSSVPRQRKMPPGCKQGDLIGVPWELALAMRHDGWYWREDVIWHKPNAMPEPVRSRSTRAHEIILHFTKVERGYLYDYEAVKEPAVSDHSSGNGFKRGARVVKANPDGTPDGGGRMRNRRSVWTVPNGSNRGVQTATYPTSPARADDQVVCSSW